MSIANGLHYGQAKSRSHITPIRRNSIKPVENPLMTPWVNSNAAVLDDDKPHFVILPGFNGNKPAVGRVFDRIVQQIHQNLLQAIPVPRHYHCSSNGPVKLNRLVDSQQAHLIYHFQCQRMQVYRVMRLLS